MPQPRTSILLCAALSLPIIFAPSAHAQTPSSSTPQTNPKPGQLVEFTVATIKPVNPKSSSIRTEVELEPDGIVKIYGFPLKAIIHIAFNVDYWQIIGGDAWTNKNLYNIVGEPPDAIRQSRVDMRHTADSIEDPHLRQMLQALLIQRFQLKIHTVTQVGKVYFLERTDKKLALVPVKSAGVDTPSPLTPSGAVEIYGRRGIYDTTMSQLASFASGYVLHRPVLDHTGITGAFNYVAPPEDSKEYQADPLGSFMNLLNDMGLKVQTAKGPAEMLVIDHAELPSPN
ncbi:MAG TPA: TIGR03435 family protein [Acidobacteriaceae bacterium]